VADETEAEVDRLLELLRTVIKISGFQVSEIERRIGQSAGYLSRLRSGAIEVKLRHIYDILTAIELHPAEFFRLGYPQEPAHPSPTGRKLRAFVTTLQGSPQRSEPAAPSSEQIQELLTGLRELLAERSAPTRTASPEPERSRRR